MRLSKGGEPCITDNPEKKEYRTYEPTPDSQRLVECGRDKALGTSSGHGRVYNERRIDYLNEERVSHPGSTRILNHARRLLRRSRAKKFRPGPVSEYPGNPGPANH